MEDKEVIRTFKLTSGEEIIAKSKLTANGDLELYDVRTVILIKDNLGKLGLSLNPMFLSSDKSKPVLLNKNGIVAYTEYVRQDILDSYRQAVSPLTMPNPGIIMG